MKEPLQKALAARMPYYAHGNVIHMKPALGIFPAQASNRASVRGLCLASAARRVGIGGKHGW